MERGGRVKGCSRYLDPHAILLICLIIIIILPRLMLWLTFESDIPKLFLTCLLKIFLYLHPLSLIFFPWSSNLCVCARQSSLQQTLAGWSQVLCKSNIHKWCQLETSCFSEGWFLKWKGSSQSLKPGSFSSNGGSAVKIMWCTRD